LFNLIDEVTVMAELLEPDLLQTFVAIADSGSFTRAAQRVCRTQSAVSMQMKRLEERVGRPLFGRNGRAAVLTTDGELFLNHARRVLQAHQQALAAFDASALTGSVILGCPDDYVSTFLPPILARFAETHPQVHVEVICEATVQLLERLTAGTVELALVTHGHGDDSGIVVHREPLVWVTSARHSVHEQTPLPLALYQPGCIFRRSALAALAAQNRTSRVVYSSLSMTGLEAALRAGLAVSVLGKSTVPEGLRILGEREGFPVLPNYSIALRRANGMESPVLDRLEQHIIDSFQVLGVVGAD
jgi:DNA-binding transcriptional LysR family regulator